MTGIQTTTLATAAVLALSLTALAAPENSPQEKPAAPPAEPGVDARQIWPAGLDRLAGRYVFVQVASPGGLWETAVAADGTTRKRQVSINEISADWREKLENATITISLEEGPRRVSATQRESPSKRGNLRFYEEEALGKVAVRNLPGVHGGEGVQNFSGPALLRLNHQSHSNPSVSGVLRARQQQEQTWGAATLDYADLAASTIPSKPDDEGTPVLANVRVLRSGTEMFAYVEWSDKAGGVMRTVQGAVRLLRQQEASIPTPLKRDSLPVSSGS